MARRRRTNPLALAILSVLQEEPRHPYDIAATLKVRHKHESIRLNYGALYSVIDGLREDGFVEIVDQVRDGRRPARTVYGITGTGLAELTDWLTDLLGNPEKEYTRFEAALSLLPSLPPEVALAQLRRRIDAIEAELDRFAQSRDRCRAIGLPRLFVIELDFSEASLRTEHTFVTDLIAEIEAGALEGLDLWTSWYEDGALTNVSSPLPEGPSETARPER